MLRIEGEVKAENEDKINSFEDTATFTKTRDKTPDHRHINNKCQPNFF